MTVEDLKYKYKKSAISILRTKIKELSQCLKTTKKIYNKATDELWVQNVLKNSDHVTYYLQELEFLLGKKHYSHSFRKRRACFTPEPIKVKCDGIYVIFVVGKYQRPEIVMDEIRWLRLYHVEGKINSYIEYNNIISVCNDKEEANNIYKRIKNAMEGSPLSKRGSIGTIRERITSIHEKIDNIYKKVDEATKPLDEKIKELQIEKKRIQNTIYDENGLRSLQNRSACLRAKENMLASKRRRRVANLLLKKVQGDKSK